MKCSGCINLVGAWRNYDLSEMDGLLGFYYAIGFFGFDSYPGLWLPCNLMLYYAGGGSL